MDLCAVERGLTIAIIRTSSSASSLSMLASTCIGALPAAFFDIRERRLYADSVSLVGDGGALFCDDGDMESVRSGARGDGESERVCVSVCE